jgi:hypothetical protein
LLISSSGKTEEPHAASFFLGVGETHGCVSLVGASTARYNAALSESAVRYLRLRAYAGTVTLSPDAAAGCS